MEKIIKQKLKERISDTCFNYLKTKRAYIAGGALTSALTNRKINDYDIYFRTLEECKEAIDHFTKDPNYVIVATTENAITFENKRFSGPHIQLIQKEEMINECVYDTISKFDFTINMAAYDTIGDTVIAHVNFYKDNMQRVLVFNEDTKYPIVSIHRAIKYMQRGYKLPGYEQVKIALAINNLKMKNYRDLKIQLQGIDTSVFQPITDKLMERPETGYDYESFKKEMNNINKGDDECKTQELI